MCFISYPGKVYNITKFYVFTHLQDETMDAMSNSMGNIRFVYISEPIGTTVQLHHYQLQLSSADPSLLPRSGHQKPICNPPPVLV
jgi:hypothetical protein